MIDKTPLILHARANVSIAQIFLAFFKTISFFLFQIMFFVIYCKLNSIVVTIFEINVIILLIAGIIRYNNVICI